MRSKKGAVIDARCTLVGEKGHPPVTHTMAHDTKRHLVGDYSLDEHTPHSHPLSLSSRPPPLLLSLSHSALCSPLLSLHTLTIFVVVWVLVCFSSRCGFICAGIGSLTGPGPVSSASSVQTRPCDGSTRCWAWGEAEDMVKEHTQRRCCLAVRAASTTPVSPIPPYIIQPISMSQLLSPLPPIFSHGSTR
jgi:hypothetical protein